MINYNEIERVQRKIHVWGYTSKIIGNSKRYFFILLQKIFKFGTWHVSPINDRPYAQEIVRFVQHYVDKRSKKTIVEIGCGLAGILGNIYVPINGGNRKIGLDINKNNLKAGKFLHPSCTMILGSFDKVCVGKIDCLIMVNFLHLISEDELRDAMKTLLKRNCVELIVFDTLQGIEGTDYLHSHKGEYFLGEKYRRIKKSKGFIAAQGARRYIEYWELV